MYCQQPAAQTRMRKIIITTKLCMKQTVVVGITSGIAAYKSLELIKLLKEEKLEIFVILSHHATQMVPIDEFEKASGNKVAVELFQDDFDYKIILKSRKVDHIELADKADVFVIVPATANTVAKLSHGIADDFLTTTALAVTAPTIICPSMNVNMWNNPAVQENINLLRKRGAIIIEPTEGMLACGYEGKGRLVDIAIIKDEILKQLHRTNSLRSKKIIVTAGGTIEKIDDVRFIANRSSGKMGVAIAEECYLRGSDVLLLRSKNSVSPRYLVKEKLFSTTDDLFTLVKQYIKEYDYIYHVAAVSDFTLLEPFTGKIKSGKALTLRLKPQVKILGYIKKLNPRINLIAFKAEHNSDEKELVQIAKKKLQDSNADAIVANDISRNDRGFEADTNEVFIVQKNGQYIKFALNSKKEIAKHIIEEVHGLV